MKKNKWMLLLVAFIAFFVLVYFIGAFAGKRALKLCFLLNQGVHVAPFGFQTFRHGFDLSVLSADGGCHNASGVLL